MSARIQSIAPGSVGINYAVTTSISRISQRVRFPVEIYIVANRVLDVCKCLFDVRALRMTSQQFRTTH
jgi:hypothetical protein